MRFTQFGITLLATLSVTWGSAEPTEMSNSAKAMTQSGKSASVSVGQRKSVSSKGLNPVAGGKQSTLQGVDKKSSREGNITQTNNVKVAVPVTKQSANKQKVNKAAQVRPQRAESPLKSTKSHEFEIYDARSYLIDDIDGDGFYSEFEIEFDADTIYSSASVYAMMYISRNNGPWERYYTTDVFTIYGDDPSDDYSVVTVLNFDYPTDEYDILIDLYEYGYDGIVATWSSYEDPDLYALPLEDRDHESNFSSGFWFYDITTDLLYDNDGDGFYSEFAIAFDIDTDYVQADVYAEVFFLNEYGEWELEYVSDDIYLEGDSTLDTVHLEFDWTGGYPTDYYDFKIVVRDAYSDERLIETYGEFGALNAIPLESADYDNSYDSGGGSSNSGGATHSHGHGGSLSLLSLLSLILFGLRRKMA